MALTIEKRRELTDGLMAIEFEDNSNYTLTELEEMDDNELEEAYKEEMADISAAEADIDLEECCVCGEMKVCDFADEETGGSVCAECADEAEEDGDGDEEDEDEDEDEEGFEEEEGLIPMTAYEPVSQYVDHLFSLEATKPALKAGKIFISPFGVLLGKNLSGEKRAEQVLNDKPFMNSIRQFGVVAPVFVRRVDYEGKPAYLVVAGNRRVTALRHVIGEGAFGLDDPRAQVPIYEMNEIEMEHVSPEDAANLLENGMRRQLDHISKAILLDELVTKEATTDELSLLVPGKSGKPLNKETIRQYRSLLKLHPKVQDAVRDNVMQVSRAATLIDLSHEDQIKVLGEILEAQGMSSNKHKAALEVINKHKAKTRKDADGEPIFDPPRPPAVIRSTVRRLASKTAWSALPRAQRLTDEGYAAVSEIFSDLEQWLNGGLTPRRYKPEDIALTLQTRLLAVMARFAKRA